MPESAGKDDKPDKVKKPKKGDVAIAFGAVGTAGPGTTSGAPTLPSGITAGMLLLCGVCNKYPSNGPATPAGWTLLGQYSGGAGSSGVDSGNVYITVFARVADGVTDTAPTITVASGNSIESRISRYTAAAGMAWSIAVAGGSSNTPGTAWAVTGDVDPGITSGDMVVIFSAVNGDVATAFATPTVVATGATMAAGSNRYTVTTGNGDDTGLESADAACTAGTSTAVPVFTATANSTSGNTPAGASIFVRLREVPGGQVVQTLDGETLSSSGLVSTKGTLAVTLDGETVAATGTLLIQGSAAVTLDGETVAATGTLPILGTLAVTEDDDTAGSTGVLDSPAHAMVHSMAIGSYGMPWYMVGI